MSVPGPGWPGNYPGPHVPGTTCVPKTTRLSRAPRATWQSSQPLKQVPAAAGPADGHPGLNVSQQTGGREQRAGGCACVSSSARTLAEGSQNVRGWQAAESRARGTRVPPGGVPQPSPELAQARGTSLPTSSLASGPLLALPLIPGTLAAGPPSPSLSVLTLQPSLWGPQCGECSGSGLSTWLHKPAHATYALRTSVSPSIQWINNTSACFGALRSDAYWEFSREGRAGKACTKKGGDHTN